MPQVDRFLTHQTKATRVIHREHPNRFHRGFDSTPTAIRDVLHDLRLHLAESGINPDHLGSVEIVMAEVLNNISRHAHGIRTPGRVTVSAVLRGDSLQIAVRDSGAAMPGGQLPLGRLPNIATAQQDLPEGGFGWFLIRDLTDSVHYTRKDAENCLDLRFFCPKAAD